MSFAKRQWERQMEEGWRSKPDCYVCAKCFADESVQDFVHGKATECECTYCRLKSAEPIAAELDEVMSFLSAGLGNEYTDPGNAGVGSIDGEWAISPDDTVTLLDEHEVFAEAVPESLKDDIADAFSDRVWVRKDPYGRPREDELRASWKGFSHQVRHSVRFFFHRVKVRSFREFDYPQPREILATIGGEVDYLDLVTELDRGARFVRARQHKTGKKLRGVKGIGPPDDDSAAQNRFSPAGIAMFYGAEDAETARKEIFSAKKGKAVTYGYFISRRKLRLLDLRALPPVPSLFNSTGAERRSSIKFMHYFRRTVSVPVTKDGREHIEYVPTQVVSEYFRHVYRNNGRRIDGLLYESVRNPGKFCVTLFIGRDDCGEKPRQRGTTLFLQKTETVGLGP